MNKVNLNSAFSRLIFNLSHEGGGLGLKKLMFITLKEQIKLDGHIKNNRFKNINDNIRFIESLGYKTSKTAMHRYMAKLRDNEYGGKVI